MSTGRRENDRHRSRLHAGLPVVAMLLLSGCAAGLAYERADWLLARWIGGYVSLERPQEEVLDASLAQLLDWHRAAALPAYADWTEAVAARIAAGGPVGQAEVMDWIEAATGFWREGAAQAAPHLVALGRSLDDEQVDELLAELREKYREDVEEYEETGHEERRREHARDMERFLARWTGDLSTAQRVAISRWSREARSTTPLWLESRRGWIAELAEALDRRDEPGVLDAAVERLVVQPESRWPHDYREAVDANTVLTAGLLAEVLGSLDARQRLRARSRLSGLAEDFTEWSGRSDKRIALVR
jgi:hypothetical protein